MSKFTKTDALFFKYLIKTRGRICEIHNRACPCIGTMHILSKQSAPRLRYDEMNVVLAGYFCSHYHTHHSSDDPRSVYARKRICELRGFATWEALRDAFKLRAHIAKKVDLALVAIWLKEELKK